MKREDDQSLWDLLGRAAEPRLSPFFARNVLRHVRQRPQLLGRPGFWLRWRIAAPASAAAVAVVVAAFFLRSAPPQPAQKAKLVAVTNASQPGVKVDALAEGREMMTKDDRPGNQPALADIDEQDYEVVANLDDLQVLYETSLWDENSSL